MKTFATLTALALATAIVPVAQADTTYDARSETVQYADLKAASAPGAATLFKRMNHAAQRVCGALQPRSLSLVEKYESCVHRALGDAIASINEPAVSAYAEARGVLPEVATLKIVRAN